MVIAIIQNLVKNYLTKKVITDNIVFRLHYQFTVVILVLFGMLATSNQLFSNPIVCSIGPKNFDQNFINAYCWIHPTFIVNQPTPDDQVLDHMLLLLPTILLVNHYLAFLPTSDLNLMKISPRRLLVRFIGN